MARMVFASAWPLAVAQPSMPFVFASQHGDTPQSYALLEAMGVDDALSPTEFSLSVHNAIPGLWSILRQETDESVALSAQADTLENGLIEAQLLLNDGAPSVIVAIAEIRPPSAYLPWIDNVPFSFAIALRISSGNTWTITRRTESTPATPGWHAGLNTLAHLLRGETCWKSPGTHWSWQHQA